MVWAFSCQPALTRGTLTSTRCPAPSQLPQEHPNPKSYTLNPQNYKLSDLIFVEALSQDERIQDTFHRDMVLYYRRLTT